MSADTHVTFKFMAKRTADATVQPPPAGCVYVDWGDLNEGPFFDHHGLSEVTCSTALVNSEAGWKRLRGIVAEARRTGSPVCVVTHTSPDLDSVASACTVIRAAREDGAPLHREVVQYVLSKDQGMEVGEDPAKSIALLFQALKHQCADKDEETMRAGIALVDAVERAVRTRSFRLGWNDPADLVGTPVDTRAIQVAILGSRKRLRDILANAPRLLLALPAASDGNREFDWVDGCLLDFSKLKSEPLGWKEYVRHDIHGSLQGGGFGFMAVVSNKRGRENFIASVDPRIGMSLAGLGAQLESAETHESERLMPLADQWNERLKAVAAARKTDGRAPTLLRHASPPRPGFENNDPWYDGRGHGYTIVDTPESGSVLERDGVLCQILALYDPLWREMVERTGARLCFAGDHDACVNASPDWLQLSACSWVARTPQPGSHTDAGTDPVLADLVNALARIETRTPFAAYTPVAPCPPQLLPQSQPLLHLHLALYLAMHGLTANSPQYPDLARLNQWVAEFAWRPLPGVWCAVSERGAIMIDYVSGTNGQESAVFQRFRDGYFGLIKQLVWTGSLTDALKNMKRYEALRDFAKRSAVE